MILAYPRYRNTSHSPFATTGISQFDAIVLGHAYFCLISTGDARLARHCRCHTGHAGPAHSQGVVAGTDAWVGNRQPHSTDIARHLPDRARVPVPRAPSLRASWLADVLLAYDREQPYREVLRSHGAG